METQTELNNTKAQKFIRWLKNNHPDFYDTLYKQWLKE